MDRLYRRDLQSILHYVLVFCACLILVKVIGRNMQQDGINIILRRLCFVWFGTADKCISIGVSLGKH